jgi:murein L,D-transpeptidase YafK
MNFLKTALLLLVFTIGSAFTDGSFSFEENQKTFGRVKEAYERKEELIKMKCRSLDISEENFGNMFLRVFKEEGIMELWVQNISGKYVLFKEFKIYAVSGKLGPKREQGDRQVPEGFYYINDFNPQSNYYLSLGINYPNEADMINSTAIKKGGDIYIHGAAVSAGCMAMSNYYIEDIYICAVKAHSNGQQKIPVWIFPFKPTIINMAYFNQYDDCKPHAQFWKNLAQGNQFFERTNRLPDISVMPDGTYHFTDPQSTRASK